MNCTPILCLYPNAKSSPLSNLIAAGSFIELDIDINNSNSNCMLESEYLNESSAEVSNSVPGYCTPLKSEKKRQDSKEIYNVRKKSIAAEEE